MLAYGLLIIVSFIFLAGNAMQALNQTHDPALKSWVETANHSDSDFPIQNLPYGVFSTDGDSSRVGIAIGDQILDLAVIEAAGLVRPGGDQPIFDRRELNPFMALGPKVWSSTRGVISSLLCGDDPKLCDNGDLRSRALIPQSQARLHLPFFVRSYTDFYASREHASNVGTMFRGPEKALSPNWLHIPIGYNGRASTVVVSGTPIHRPLGQMKAPGETEPRFGPCQKLDIELELGAVVGTPNGIGRPVTTAEAFDMIFGYVLLNDWSARDIQVWEYQPLGPFQSKVFASSISPWVVTREALEPYRVNTPARANPLLPYLNETTPNNFDIEMSISLAPAESSDTVISRTNYKGMYYSSAQQLAHHAVGGCAMETGDLLGSGTISGQEPGTYGSLLELTWNGRDPIAVDGGNRSFIEDHDTLTLAGWCSGQGHRIGFGTCKGTILPSPAMPQEWRTAQ